MEVSQKFQKLCIINVEFGFFHLRLIGANLECFSSKALQLSLQKARCIASLVSLVCNKSSQLQKRTKIVHKVHGSTTNFKDVRFLSFG